MIDQALPVLKALVRSEQGGRRLAGPSLRYLGGLVGCRDQGVGREPGRREARALILQGGFGQFAGGRERLLPEL